MTRDGCHFSNESQLRERRIKWNLELNRTHFLDSNKEFFDHGYHAEDNIWSNHLRRPSSHSPLLCSRNVSCALSWTWNTFATFRKHFWSRTCKDEGMSSERCQLRLGMSDPFHLKTKNKNKQLSRQKIICFPTSVKSIHFLRFKYFLTLKRVQVTNNGTNFLIIKNWSVKKFNVIIC